MVAKIIRLMLILFLSSFPSRLLAADETNTAVLGVYGAVDQTVSLNFPVRRAEIVRERMLGDVVVQDAMRKELVEGEGAYEVGAPVKVNSIGTKSGSFHYTFFLYGENGQFAATKVRAHKKTEVLTEIKSIGALEGEVEQVERELSSIRSESLSLEKELAVLRAQVSEIAGVDEIVELKLKLSGLSGQEEQNVSEIERLKKTVERARSLQEPKNIRELQGKLSKSLKDTAQKTAMSDRLSKRKKEVGRQRFRRKLALVRAAEGVDVEALAREVLRLRKQRRGLEARSVKVSDDKDF